MKEKLNIECPHCKTKSLFKSKNMRADASFEYFIHCDKCKKWVGKIEWESNEIILYKNPL